MMKDGTAYSTDYPNIYTYWNGRSKKWMYRVRLTYYIGSKKKEHSKSGFVNLTAAKKHLAEMEEKVRDGYDVKKSKKITWWEHYQTVRDYRIQKGKWKKKYLRDNKYLVKVLKEYFGDVPLQRITSRMVQDFIDDFYQKGGVKGDGIKQSTMEQYLKLFWAIINDAVKKDILDKNRTKDVDFEQEGYKLQERKMTDNEFHTFIHLGKEQLKPVFYLALELFTYGLRLGEVTGIRIKDLTFLPNGTSLVKLKINVTSEGIGDLKTKSSYRWVAFSVETTNLLQEQINRARVIKKKKGVVLHHDDFIFISEKFGTVYNPATIYNYIKDIAKQVNPDISPHWFRHYFATDALAKGVDSMALKKILGHESLDITARYAKNNERLAINVLENTRESNTDNTVNNTVT